MTSQDLSTNEQIAYYYMKYSDFFVNVLSSFKYAIVNYAQFKNYCKVFTIPTELTSTCVGGIRAKFTGEELKMIYCNYLKNSAVARVAGKLPNPLTNCQ